MNDDTPPASDNHATLPADWMSRMLRKTRAHPVVDLVTADQAALYGISQVYAPLREPLARIASLADAPKQFDALRMVLESGERDLHGTPLLAKAAMIWGHCDKQVIAASPNTLTGLLALSDDIHWRTETLARVLPDLKAYIGDTALAALPPPQRQAYEDLFAAAAAQAARMGEIDTAMQQAYRTYQETPHPEIDEEKERSGWAKSRK